MDDFASGLPQAPATANLSAAVAAGGEDALALFDAAVVVVEPDRDLLNGAPARALTAAMTQAVASLTKIDPARVARRQSWFHRFTGADLEARLEFEVAVGAIGEEMRGLSGKAQDARRALHLIIAEIDKLDAAHPRNEALILTTRDVLAAVAPGSDTARLERRLGNLEALHASNQLARAHLVLAVDHLRGLLDRHRDIEQLLFPVWQQHALAVAQSAVAPGGLSEPLSALETAQAKLAGALRRHKEDA